MKRIGAFFFIFAFFHSLSFTSTSSPLSMRIVYAPRALVLGEPLFVVVSIKNTSSQTLFLRKDDSLTASLFHQKNGEKVKCDVPLHQIIPPDKLPFSPIKPGWSKVLSYSFLNCKLTAGIYTLSIQYTYTYRKGDGRTIFQKITKNIRLTISYPSGVDEDAYKKTNGCPMCKKEWVLKHYPTSTYAGWALWQMAHSYVTSWNWYDIKADKAFRLPPFGTIAKTSEKNIWNTLRKLVRYYPDFALRDEALYLYAIGSLRVKVVREARWALSKLAREYPDSPWREKARAIEAFLQTLSHKTQ